MRDGAIALLQYLQRKKSICSVGKTALILLTIYILTITVIKFDKSESLNEIENKSWKFVLSFGAVPSPRFGHSCTLVGNILYVFGGNDGSRYLNDIYVFDIGINHSNFVVIFRNEQLVRTFCIGN